MTVLVLICRQWIIEVGAKDRDKYVWLKTRALAHRCGQTCRGGLSSHQIDNSIRVMRVSTLFRVKYKLITWTGSQRGRGGIEGARQRIATRSSPEGGNYWWSCSLHLLVVSRDRATFLSAEIPDINLLNRQLYSLDRSAGTRATVWPLHRMCHLKSSRHFDFSLDITGTHRWAWGVCLGQRLLAMLKCYLLLRMTNSSYLLSYTVARQS